MNPYLTRALETNQLPHALLFWGDEEEAMRGAKELSAHLLGKEENHPDLHLLQQPSMEQIRSLVAEASLPPFQAPCKIFVLAAAHRMTPMSANALLKTLEEPLSHSYLILIVERLSQLLPTLVSRCAKVFFPQRFVGPLLQKAEPLCDDMMTFAKLRQLDEREEQGEKIFESALRSIMQSAGPRWLELAEVIADARLNYERGGKCSTCLEVVLYEMDRTAGRN